MAKANDLKSGGLPLRPRARIMRTLGEELISSETVAVIELVKNSYDADASRVLVRFGAPLVAGQGFVEVIDNGSGMSLDTIRSAWMEPATPSKRRNSKSTTGRRVLGEKGIGRFASSRLSTDLEVITRTKDSDSEIFVVFDWTQFDNDDRYLDEVEILWEERTPIDVCPGGSIQRLWTGADRQPSPAQLDHGTILRMKGLKQNWSIKQFEELRRGLARLVSPIGSANESDFEISLDLPPEFAQFSEKVEPPKILKYPHYSIRGKVEADGKFDLSIRVYATGEKQTLKGRFVDGKPGRLVMVKEGDVSQAIGSNARPPATGPFDVELRIWDRDDLGNVEQKTGSSIGDVRRDLDATAGVNLYRDGFRVLPYGEPNNDWLRLDFRRVQNPTLRLSNNQILGFVGITRDKNPLLRDQSNREGLDDGQPLEDLRQIIHLILAEIEEARYKSRPRREAASKTPIGSLFATFNFDNIREQVDKSGGDKATKQIIDETEKAFGKQLHEIQAVLARYQRLATLGQLIDVVLHDGRQPLAAIHNEAILASENIEDSKGSIEGLRSSLLGRLKTIRNQGDLLSTAFRRIEPFSGRRRGRPSQLYLENIIRDAFAVFSSEIEATKTKIHLPKTETLVRVDHAEVQEVVVNLLQNSLYWLTHVADTNRQIVVQVNRIGPEQVDIVFSDSGPGVPTDLKDLIFEPYFSKKPEGVGLGLSIAGEIISDYYDGSLVLLDNGPLPGATFRISLRKRV